MEHLAQWATADRAHGEWSVAELLEHLDVLPARLAGVLVRRHALDYRGALRTSSLDPFRDPGGLRLNQHRADMLHIGPTDTGCRAVASISADGFLHRHR